MKESKIKTVPNQHIVVVHRKDTGKQFIAINKHNFTKAYRDMSNASAALALYIWLLYRFPSLNVFSVANDARIEKESAFFIFKRPSFLDKYYLYMYIITREITFFNKFFQTSINYKIYTNIKATDFSAAFFV